MKLEWAWIASFTILLLKFGPGPCKQSLVTSNRPDNLGGPSFDSDVNQKTCTLDSQCEEFEFCQPRNSRSRFGLCVCNEGFKPAADGSCLAIHKEIRDVNSTDDIQPSNFSENKTTIGESTTEESDNTMSTVPTIASLSTPITTYETPTTTIHIPPSAKESPNTTTDTKTISVQDVATSHIPDTTASTTHALQIRKLVVSAGGSNHILQLPENKISLSAFAVPDPPEGEEYVYEWSLILHPAGHDAGREEDRHTKTLQLSNLKEGLYTFKVEVTGKGAYGYTFVNVTVMPPKRVNKAPVAVISPKNVTIKLPNTDAVLDGSQSTDDEKIVKYQWEEVLSPIGYEPKLTDTATLQLKNLIAGFYQFRLTVTDSDGETNSTVADVTVLKEVDYPPVANAGKDVVIFLPQTEYILNGNGSSDDKGIKSWQWSKSSETTLPVDVQGTTTPYLHLSKLQKGMYKFILKVVDEARQSAVATVHIFVKEKQQNDPPKVDAGPDQEIKLIDKFAILGGSKTGGTEIVSWNWSQISGPNTATIENASEKKTKASDLTVGTYKFQLEATDKLGQMGKDAITVTVNQLKNIPPKANAGGGKTVVLPIDVVFLNGSLTSDDRGITSYKWKRDPSSLAAGEIIENSDTKPILKIINLIPGRYVFTLTVTDDQGESSSDSVSVIVKHSTEYKDEVQLILNVDLKSYTEENKETLKNKLALLLNEGSPIKVLIKKIFGEFKTGRVVIVFCVYVTNSESEKIVRGPNVVMRLKDKLNTDNLLDFDVVSLDTVVCQNNCSNHGTCEPYSKRCVCDAFWMENFIRALTGDKESNCDWSILYVGIVIFTCMISIGILIWIIICCCRKKSGKLKPKKHHRYTLLDTTDEGDETDVISKGQIHNSSLMISESDTDSDTFLQRNSKISNSNGQLKINGSARHTRKVKA